MSKPNLIYVFADQLRFSSVGFNGDCLAKTPCLDALALESANMVNACSNHPVCAPYRASLFTGKYTTGTGMVINEIRINPNHETFANVLNNAGYETSYIGKWHMYASRLGHHYDVENSYIPKGKDRLGFNGYFAAYNFHHEYYSPRAYYHLDSPEKIYYDKYEPDAQTDMAIERIKAHSESARPFALFLSYGTPHDPWNADNVPAEYYEMFKNTNFPLPPNYKKHNDPHADLWAKFLPGRRSALEENKRVYYAMCANLDYNVGRLCRAVSEMGLDNNTIFVFTSDHGEMFGAQGRHAKNIFYDEAARVPFLIKWPGHIPCGKNKTCFGTVDIMQTLLSMMGLAAPQAAQGRDVSAHILNGTFANNPCLLMGTGPTAIYGNGREWRAVRTERYTFATYKSDKSKYLFDNVEDPYQTRNLAEDPRYSALLAQLENEMLRMMKNIGDDFEKNSFYKKHWVKNRKILPELKRRSDL
ncbi:MAG: sulfatase [Clostridiales bacterium]|nr:sulfatase [Clostridiales bacterium]